MSYTTVLCLNPEDTTPDAIKTLKELRNSNGSAPVVWNTMCKKYFGTKDHSYMFDGTLDKLWPLYKDESIPEYHRTVLMMTYDRAYVARDNYERAAADIRKWLEDFPPNPEYVNHWPELATIYESKPDCAAVGLHCTSVSENPFEGEYDEEAEEYLPINWKEEAFEIYSELESLNDG